MLLGDIENMGRETSLTILYNTIGTINSHTHALGACLLHKYAEA